MEVYHVGIDLHKSFSLITVLNEKGVVLERERMYSDVEDFSSYFSRFPSGTPVTLEATGNWYWVCDLLQKMNMNVKLANPKKVRLIAESVVKTDKIDSEVLAQLERTNFLPEAYIPSIEVRSTRELLRYRMSLVRIRTGIKNKIHAVLRKTGVNHCFTDLFGKKGIEYLKNIEMSEIYRKEINGYLEMLEKIKEIILSTEKDIKKATKESDEAKLLMSIPGISYFSALLLTMEIGDIKRFASYRKLCSYGGVVSSTTQSGDKMHQGHIIKDSNRYIRWCLIEAAHKAKSKDPKLGYFYNKLTKKKGGLKAKVAVARKLLISIYYMLKNKEEYKFGNKKNKIKKVQVSPAESLAA